MLGSLEKFSFMLKLRRECIWEISTVAAPEEISDRGKCIKRLVPNVEKTAKSRSNPLKAGRFTAEIASRKEDNSNSLSNSR